MFTDDTDEKTVDAFKVKMGEILKRALKNINIFEIATREGMSTSSKMTAYTDRLKQIKKLEKLGQDTYKDQNDKLYTQYLYIEAIKEEIELLEKGTEEMTKQSLIEQGFSEEYANKIIGMNRVKAQAEQTSQYQTAYNNAFGFGNKVDAKYNLAQSKMLEAYLKLKDAIENNTDKVDEASDEYKEAVKEFNKATTEKLSKDTITSAIGGTDVGAFAEWASNGGGVWGGIINMFFSALSNVIGGIKGVSLALSPFTTALKELAPIIKVVLIIFMMLTPILKALTKAIMALLDFLTFGLFSNASNAYDEMIDEVEGTSESLRDMRNDMKKLSDAIAEQSEYYLKKKKELMSLTYKEGVGYVKETSVNDMILTPQGNFSTHPDDYIIATKNPSELNGGNKGGVVQIQPIINNYASNDTQAEIKTKQNGNITQLLVTISKKVASDVANGENGWDNALSARESRVSGRRISL